MNEFYVIEPLGLFGYSLLIFEFVSLEGN